MHPARTRLEEILAAKGAWCHILDLPRAATFDRHRLPPWQVRLSARRRQKFMNGGNDLGAFTDCGRHALDGAGANVSDRERSGKTGLQRMAILADARPDEPLLVERDIAACKPVRIRIGANQ
jgi:hypothetical protein